MIYQELDSCKINHFLSGFISLLIVSCEPPESNVLSTTHLRGLGVNPLVPLGVLLTSSSIIKSDFICSAISPRYPLSTRIFLIVGQKKDVCLQSG